MENTSEINYQRIKKVIQYIQHNFTAQNDLDKLASLVHLSPFHFQRMFTEWAGTSPKKFIQYNTIEFAKQLLKQEQKTLFQTTEETGLSGTGRLHDLFVTIEGMTPAEYKNEGEGLQLHYSFMQSPFGKLIIASSLKGICHMAFYDESDQEAVHHLKAKFPKANYIQAKTEFHQQAVQIFSKSDKLSDIKLHLKASPFQLKVWQALLKIPSATISTYGKLAQSIDNSKASRAVGTAIGQNPIAYIIPCHRVIQSLGETGGYRWDPLRKKIILAWEFSQDEMK